MRGHFFIICVHAPIQEKNEEEKDSFYEDLDRLYDDCPKRDIKIIVGDMNAKVGKEDGTDNWKT
jgi:exonuclease III